MDCRWAMEILDSARPDSDDRQQRELHEAATHLEQCPTCEALFRSRQLADRQLGIVMRDVPVPADLLNRLTTVLATANHAGQTVRLAASNATSGNAPEHTVAIDEAVDVPTSQITTNSRDFARRSTGRRQFLGKFAAVSAACALVGLCGWWIFHSPAPTLTVAKIVEMAPLQLEGVDEFDNNFAAALPLGWQNDSLHFSRSVKGFGRNSRDEHQVALVEFRFPDWDGSPLTGVLAIVPSDQVDSSGLPDDFFTATGSPGYANRPWGGYTTLSWVADDMVYVCFVPEQGDAQRRLEQILGHETA